MLKRESADLIVDALRALIGFALLWVFLPIISIATPQSSDQLGLREALSFGNLLGTRAGWTYLLLCLGAAFSFSIIATHRRVMFALFLLCAAVWSGYKGDINWLGWVVTACVVCATAIAVETVRQNYAFIVGVWNTDRKIIATTVRQTAKLWSPVLLLIGIGVGLNIVLVHIATGLMYDTPMVDEYCEITLYQPVPDVRRFPCTHRDGVIYPTDETRFDVQQNIDEQIPEIYLLLQQTLLQELASARDTDLQGTAFNAKVADLTQRMTPILLLGLPDVRQALTAISRDPELRTLRLEWQKREAAWRDAQRRADEQRTGGWLGGLSHNIALGLLRLQADQARERALARQNQLRTQYDVPVETWNEEKEIATRLYALDPRQPPIATASSADNRTALERFVVENSARLSKETTAALHAHMAGIGEADELTQENVSERFYTALRLKPLCSLASRRETNEDNPDPEVVDRESYECWQLEAGPNPVTPLGVVTSLEASLDLWKREARLKLDLSLQDAILATDTAEGATLDTGRGLIAAVPTGIWLGRGRCKWYDPRSWLTCGVNWGKSKAEGGYATGRAYAGRIVERELVEGVDEGGRLSVRQLMDTYWKSTRLIDDSAQRLREGIETGARIIAILGLLSNVALYVAIIKSILHVLTITTFNNAPHLRVALPRQRRRRSDPDTEPVQGDLNTSAMGNALEVDAQEIIAARPLTNAVPGALIFGWPWPLSSPFARILARKYLKQYRCQRADVGHPMSFSSEGESVIHWTLKPGEEVVFRFRDFYGASRNIKFGSIVSLSVASMPFGRIVFHCARCTGPEPGHLLLKAQSLHRVNDRAVVAGIGVIPGRLIAWNRHAEFSLQARQDHLTMMLGGYSLNHRGDGKSGGLIVAKASGDSDAAGGGVIDVLLRILSPF